MNYVNIILIILLIFFIILNIYYSINIRNCILKNNVYDNFENPKIQFLDTYQDENIQYGISGTFNNCQGNLCSTTTQKLIDNNNTFMNTDSQYHTNFTLKNITDSSNNYKKYNDVMSLNALLAYRCLNISPLKIYTDLQTNLQGKVPCIYKKVYIYNEQYLFKFIKDEISKILGNNNCDKYDVYYDNSLPNNRSYCNTNLKLDVQNNRGSNRIFGPIYVSISQSPYIRVNDKQVKARFDVLNNKRAFYTEKIINGNRVTQTETGGENSSFSSLYAEIAIIFPLYEKITSSTGNNVFKMRLTNDGDRVNKFITYISQNFIKDELCNLKCNKSDLTCGCLNATRTDMSKETNIPIQRRPYIHSSLNSSGIESYDSECLSHDDKKTNYSMLYYINPYSDFNEVMTNILR